MANFPGTGSGNLPGIPVYSAYATPNGNDNARGTANAPFRTLYKAARAVIDSGGGTVNHTEGTPCGGPVADQGLWIRNDDIEVPGFINQNGARLRFSGNGQFGSFVFQRPCYASIVGGSASDFTKPGIWVVGSEVPIDFEYVASNRNGLLGLPAPVRLGWDYARKPDFSLENVDITNAVRDGSESATVFTVDLSSATAWNIVSAERFTTSGIKYVRLTVTRPLTVALSPWGQGSIVRVNTGGDTDFPNGDYTVFQQSDVLNQTAADTTVWFTYQQNGTNLTKSLSGTVRAHGCREGDMIAVNSNNAEFPTVNQMTVTDATIDTITVFDPYGYSPRSADANEDDIGTLVKQVRGRSVSSGITFDICSFYGNAFATDLFDSGACVDLGGTSANEVVFNDCYFTGGLVWNWQLKPDNYDPDRTMVAVLANPGGGTLSGASFEANRCQSQAGCVRWHPQETEAHIYVEKWLQDSAGNAHPTIQCLDGSGFASVYLNRIANADATIPAIKIGSGYDNLRVIVGETYSANAEPIESEVGFIGPKSIRSAAWIDMDSPWKTNRNTIWTGGLSTPHKGIQWTMGVVSARYANQYPPLSDWENINPFPAGVTVTQDGVGPDGSAKAFKIVNANGSSQVINALGAYPFATWSDGDGIILAASAKFSAAGGLIQVGDYSGGTLFNDGLVTRGAMSLSRYVNSVGYQPQVDCARLVTTGPFAGSFYLSITIPPGTSYIALPTLIRVPAADMSDDEFFEYAKNLKPQPMNIPAGAAGTPEGVKLIGQGGLGTNAASVEVTAPGTADRLLTIYAADGTPLIKLHGQAP